LLKEHIKNSPLRDTPKIVSTPSVELSYGKGIRQYELALLKAFFEMDRGQTPTSKPKMTPEEIQEILTEAMNYQFTQDPVLGMSTRILENPESFESPKKIMVFQMNTTIAELSGIFGREAAINYLNFCYQAVIKRLTASGIIQEDSLVLRLDEGLVIETTGFGEAYLREALQRIMGDIYTLLYTPISKFVEVAKKIRLNLEAKVAKDPDKNNGKQLSRLHEVQQQIKAAETFVDKIERSRLNVRDTLVGRVRDFQDLLEQRIQALDDPWKDNGQEMPSEEKSKSRQLKDVLEDLKGMTSDFREGGSAQETTNFIRQYLGLIARADIREEKDNEEDSAVFQEVWHSIERDGDLSILDKPYEKYRDLSIGYANLPALSTASNKEVIGSVRGAYREAKVASNIAQLRLRSVQDMEVVLDIYLHRAQQYLSSLVSKRLGELSSLQAELARLVVAAEYDKEYTLGRIKLVLQNAGLYTQIEKIVTTAETEDLSQIIESFVRQVKEAQTELKIVADEVAGQEYFKSGSEEIVKLARHSYKNSQLTKDPTHIDFAAVKIDEESSLDLRESLSILANLWVQASNGLDLFTQNAGDAKRRLPSQSSNFYHLIQAQTAPRKAIEALVNDYTYSEDARLKYAGIKNYIDLETYAPTPLAKQLLTQLENSSAEFNSSILKEHSNFFHFLPLIKARVEALRLELLGENTIGVEDTEYLNGILDLRSRLRANLDDRAAQVLFKDMLGLLFDHSESKGYSRLGLWHEVISQTSLIPQHMSELRAPMIVYGTRKNLDRVLLEEAEKDQEERMINFKQYIAEHLLNWLQDEKFKERLISRLDAEDREDFKDIVDTLSSQDVLDEKSLRKIQNIFSKNPVYTLLDESQQPTVRNDHVSQYIGGQAILDSKLHHTRLEAGHYIFVIPAQGQEDGQTYFLHPEEGYVSRDSILTYMQEVLASEMSYIPYIVDVKLLEVLRRKKGLVECSGILDYFERFSRARVGSDEIDYYRLSTIVPGGITLENTRGQQAGRSGTGRDQAPTTANNTPDPTEATTYEYRYVDANQSPTGQPTVAFHQAVDEASGQPPTNEIPIPKLVPLLAETRVTPQAGQHTDLDSNPINPFQEFRRTLAELTGEAQPQNVDTGAVTNIWQAAEEAPIQVTTGMIMAVDTDTGERYMVDGETGEFLTTSDATGHNLTDFTPRTGNLGPDAPGEGTKALIPIAIDLRGILADGRRGNDEKTGIVPVPKGPLKAPSGAQKTLLSPEKRAELTASIQAITKKPWNNDEE